MLIYNRYSHRDKFYHKYNIYICSCGNEHTAMEDNVNRNKIQSCGCLTKSLIAKANTKHGHSPRTGNSITQNTYNSMIARCTNKNHMYYKNYGEKGITICDRWLESFSNFLEDMGERPKDMTLDRINNYLGYSKDNCKWSTRKEQANNRRKTK